MSYFINPHVYTATAAPAASLFSTDTNDIKATDFRNHTVGTAPQDWSRFADRSVDPAKLPTISISTGGAISNLCLKMNCVEAAGGVAFWNIVPASTDREQEVLALLEYTSLSSTGNAFMAAVVKQASDGNNSIGSGLIKATTNALPYSGRWSVNNGTGALGLAAAVSDINVNVKFWAKVRTNTANSWHMRKVWLYGTSEPAYTNVVRANSTLEWPTAPGYPGILRNSSSAAGVVTCHYIAVAYNGVTIPLP